MKISHFFTRFPHKKNRRTIKYNPLKKHIEITQMRETQQREELEEKLRQAEKMLETIVETAATAATTTTAIPIAQEYPQQHLPYRISHYDTPEQQFSRAPAHPSWDGIICRACGAKNYVSRREIRLEAEANRRDLMRGYYY